MTFSDIQIPFKKSLKYSREKKQILNKGVKILIKSYFTQEKVRSNFNFSEDEELEFLASLNLKKQYVKMKE
ncbi:MAG: hypothetical protein ACTSRG_06890 [Candidatus Helarchaeota archaeon]